MATINYLCVNKISMIPPPARLLAGGGIIDILLTQKFEQIIIFKAVKQ